MIVPVVIDHNDSGCAAASSLDDLPMRISFLSSIERLIVLVVCMVYGIWWSICLRSLLLRVPHLNRNENTVIDYWPPKRLLSYRYSFWIFLAPVFGGGQK